MRPEKSGGGAALLNDARKPTTRSWALLVLPIALVAVCVWAYADSVKAKKGGDEALRHARTLNAVAALAEPQGWLVSVPRPDCVGYDYEPQCALRPISTQ